MQFIFHTYTVYVKFYVIYLLLKQCSVRLLKLMYGLLGI